MKVLLNKARHTVKKLAIVKIREMSAIPGPRFRVLPRYYNHNILSRQGNFVTELGFPQKYFGTILPYQK